MVANDLLPLSSMKLEKVNKTFHNVVQKLFGFGFGFSSAPKSDGVVNQSGEYRKIHSDFRLSLPNSIKKHQPSIKYGDVANRQSSKSYASSVRLLGPPEIYLSASPGKEKERLPSSGDPFMESMVANFNKSVRSTPASTGLYLPPRPQMGYTENRSPTFLSSGNPCLDFFFHVVPDTPAKDLVRRLKLAWEQDPLLALKLVCNLRGDLLEILDRLLKGPGIKEAAREEREMMKLEWDMMPIEEKRSPGKRYISLAAKWCPSLYSSYDRATLICESLARRMFPQESYPEYEGLEDAHYAHRVPDRLRKEVLGPLRKEMRLPELYMSANEWG
ncbi:unnamed protein product [Dovyalis caffra]|uniref:DUF2828 domain-containing protein n=1 Tax=Dovyalis caffra TaxID=77055 RepID=A0AAV1R2Z7_9ROSI|nr:unnamed protein product [Dovyalis caffra]